MTCAEGAMPEKWGKLWFSLAQDIFEFTEGIPNLHQHSLLAELISRKENQAVILLYFSQIPSRVEDWHKHLNCSLGQNILSHQGNSKFQHEKFASKL